MEGLQIALVLPDLWQQRAVRALREGKDVIVNAPTGAGKTWVFELFVKEAGKKLSGQAVYTVPTRALANDKLAEWQAKGWNVGIATGDRAENLEAPVIVATLETQRERLLRGEGPALLVIDEYQLLADESRGLNYEIAMAQAPLSTQLLLLSGSVENTGSVQDWLVRLGRNVELVEVLERPVPQEDMPIEVLPRAPRGISHFWAKVAAQALMADLGPLLIFAPQRASAEKMARQIAAALPQDDPITLPDFEGVDKDLKRLLKSRVAYHHSGLSYAARAGVIEPLAKAGQLRVIVATMGLAAGINFSVRSVLVSGNSYRDGNLEKSIRPDELLQMFGRAGRRGLDEIGYVITTRNSPCIMDGAPRVLHRVNEVDWPTLIRVMDHAGEKAPFNAARKMRDRMFSKQRIPLGFAGGGAEEVSAQEVGAASLLASGPVQQEILNSKGEWEPVSQLTSETLPLGESLHWDARSEGWEPALFASDILKSFGLGALMKTRQGYLKRFAIASVKQEGKRKLLGWVRDALDLETTLYEESEFEREVLPRLGEIAQGGEVTGIQIKKGRVFAKVDFKNVRYPAMIDSHGVALVNMPKRTMARKVATEYEDGSGKAIDPPKDSAAWAWRKLGLVNADGTPTRRGRIFSYFSGGEGLIIAAALEDETYPIDEICLHIANLRGGFRFDSIEGNGSERLAVTAREAYGMADFSGYLELGVPTGYGEGTAEAIEGILEGSQRSSQLANEELSRGDIERALVEWFSLLRHVCQAPDTEWDRWREMKEQAALLLERHHARTSTMKVAPLPAAVLSHKPRHHLANRHF